MASAHHVVNLMELCLNREPCPNLKIIKNLTNFLCYDINNMNLNRENSAMNDVTSQDLVSEIITLVNMQKVLYNLNLLSSNI